MRNTVQSVKFMIIAVALGVMPGIASQAGVTSPRNRHKV